MQVIEVEFTARRYHATPWDAHVNEGRLEWPPCPWRLLRALVAVGYGKCGWLEGPPEVASGMLKKLAAVNPRFALPVATESHTRHYMPVRDGKKEKRSRIFDTFLRFFGDHRRMLIVYDCTLHSGERDELARLVEGLAYLGRAESWVDARLLETGEDPELADTDNRYLWSTVAEADDASDRIRLLASLSAEEYESWRTVFIGEATERALQAAEETSQSKGKSLTAAKKKKVVAAVAESCPIDLVSAWQNETLTWQKQGWPRPPGSHWIDYRVPEDLFDRSPLRPLPQNPPFERPQAILLAIDGEGKQGTLRPLVKRALPLMERLHAMAIYYAAQQPGGSIVNVPELTGKDPQNNRLRENHWHAHWIPLSLFRAGKIDHVLVYSNVGFSRASVAAISKIRTAYSKGISKLAVNMVGQGSVADFSQQLQRSPVIQSAGLAIFRPSKVFESATPLVLRKYLARRGKKTAEGQIREELRERGYPEPVRIGIWSQQKLAACKMKGYVLRRKEGKPQPPFERSWGMTLEFTETVARCPISLGYASHFGLGLFRAVDEQLPGQVFASEKAVSEV